MSDLTDWLLVSALTPSLMVGRTEVKLLVLQEQQGAPPLLFSVHTCFDSRNNICP